MTQAKKRNAFRCGVCGEIVDVVRSRFVEHQRVLSWEAFGCTQVTRIRCIGSYGRSDDVRTKERTRARAKRRRLVDAVSGEASVLLDALLGRRPDLDVEYGDEKRAQMFALALVGYRIEFPEAPPSNGLLWCSVPKVRHDLYCRFCGELAAQVPAGRWSTQTKEQRFEIVGRHLMICALQYLAGIRKLVAPGTRLERARMDRCE